MKNQMVFRRVELKYLVTRPQQQTILNAMAPYMVPDEYGHSSIRNIYFDTPDFRLIRRSLEKPVYKEKVRMRSYGRAHDNTPVFVELKKKYRSVVYKRRLLLPQEEAFACLNRAHPWPDTQIGRELSYTVDFYRVLRPAVFLSYERDAFYCREDDSFRVTFDSDILYRQTDLHLNTSVSGIPILPPGFVLMELKVAGGLPLWMVHTLSSLHVYRVSYSKYGTAYQQMTKQEGAYHYA